MHRLMNARNTLDNLTFTPKQVASVGIAVNQDGTLRSGFQLLSFPNIQFKDIEELDPEFLAIDQEIQEQSKRDATYANYIERQKRDAAILKRDEKITFPKDFCYKNIHGLSNELKSKLILHQPSNLAQAAKIDGMTPAALTLLLAKLRQAERFREA